MNYYCTKNLFMNSGNIAFVKGETYELQKSSKTCIYLNSHNSRHHSIPRNHWWSKHLVECNSSIKVLPWLRLKSIFL